MRVLSEIDADIVALQEVDKRFGKRAATLSREHLFEKLDYETSDISVRPDSLGWHGNTLLFRKPFEIHTAVRINLPFLEPRGAIDVILKCDETGYIRIINVHLSLFELIRKKQISVLKSHIEEHSEGHPTILAGDFNEWKRHGAISNILKENYSHILPGNSFHSHWPIAAMDRFVLWGGVDLLNSGVHSSALAQRASDHLPVYIDFEIEL